MEGHIDQFSQLQGRQLMGRIGCLELRVDLGFVPNRGMEGAYIRIKTLDQDGAVAYGPIGAVLVGSFP